MINPFKYIIYIIETILLAAVLFLALPIPFSWGSKMGYALGSFIGPKISKFNDIIHRNFELSGIDLSAEEKKELIPKMWGNLGRTVFECMRLPYQDPFAKDSLYEIEGLEHLDNLINDGRPGLLFSAHYGNWELGTYVAQKRGLKTVQVTRFLNNPFARAFVNRIHERIARKVIPKGSSGAKQIIRELKAGNHVSMLADQKMNDGLAVPFFGRDAMTAPAFAKMALKFDCPFVPFQVIRLKGTRCKIIYHPPLTVPKMGTKQEKTFALLEQVNKHLENWITEHPEQWFWIHRRWPKKLYKKSTENEQ